MLRDINYLEKVTRDQEKVSRAHTGNRRTLGLWCIVNVYGHGLMDIPVMMSCDLNFALHLCSCEIFRLELCNDSFYAPQNVTTFK